MSTLKPPGGFSSWLDYAIATMNTKQPFLKSCGDDSPWGRIVTSNEFREAARTELRMLEEDARTLASMREKAEGREA